MTTRYVGKSLVLPIERCYNLISFTDPYAVEPMKGKTKKAASQQQCGMMSPAKGGRIDVIQLFAQTNEDHVESRDDQEESMRARLQALHEQCYTSRLPAPPEQIPPSNLNCVTGEARNQAVEEFPSILDQINEVRSYLEQHPKSFETVFQKICELQKFEDRMMQDFTNSKSNCDGKEIEGCASQGAKTLNCNVEEQLRSITNLSCDFRRIVQGHVLNCFELGQKDPSFLTHAVATLVLIDEFDSRKTIQSILGEPKPDQSRSELSFEDETIAGLGSTFDDRIARMFAAHVFQSADSDQSPFEATLGAATNSLIMLVVLQKEIAPCFPQRFGVFNLYRERLEKYMMPQIISLYSSGLDKLEVHALLRLIAWIEQYTYQVSQPDVTAKGKFKDDLHRGLKVLMKEYLSRVKEQVRRWLANISGRKPDIFSDNEGRLVTNDAEDILHIINMQLLVAKEHLSTPYCESILVACLDELEVMQGSTRMALETHWKAFELERLCSIVNDACRLYDKCETLTVNEKVELGVAVQKKIDDVAVGYTELAVYASTIVAQCLLDDVTRPLLHQIFSPNWEDGAAILNATMETLRDYFCDLTVWLPHYFFSKCVRCCFEQILQVYVEVALQSNRGVFQDSKQAARNLENDRITLMHFFCIKYAVEIESSGLRGRTAEYRLEILSAMSKVLLAESPSDATDACNILFREIGSDVCPAAILALVCMRKEPQGKDLSRWEGFVDKLKISNTSSSPGGAGYRLHYNLHHLLLNKKRQKQMGGFGSTAFNLKRGIGKVIDSPNSYDRGMKILLNKLAFAKAKKLPLRSVRTDSPVRGELSISSVDSTVEKSLEAEGKSQSVFNSFGDMMAKLEFDR